MEYRTEIATISKFRKKKFLLKRKIFVDEKSVSAKLNTDERDEPDH